MPKDHTMTIEQVMHEWPPAGFELITTVEFLPIQHLFVFKNADDNTRPIIRTLDIENASKVSTFDHQIYFSGQPHREAFKQFADFGVQMVINLRSAQEAAGLGFDEKAVIEEAGMTYMHIPMSLEIPDESSLQKIMGALETAGDTHVLLHCADSNRVGALWALYAGQKDNLPVDKAIAEGKAAGMSAPALEAAVREALSGH
jgi:uncharacterized protein (TIGR01244 family)